MAPIVSLIITGYNRSAFLAEAIESVLKQTYPDFELLLWDDGSTDLSLQIARHQAHFVPLPFGIHPASLRLS